MEYVLTKGQIGDWFVLYQLSKNCNPFFYREFIRELAKDLGNRPKKSKYKSLSIGIATLIAENPSIKVSDQEETQ